MVLVPEKVVLGPTQQTRKLHTIRFFRSRGWPIFAGYGIAANVFAECGFNPKLVGDKGTAFGACQWRGDRVAAIKKEFGITGSLSDVEFDQQLPWIWWELTKKEPAHGIERECGRRLSVVKSAREAGALFSEMYERPRAKEAEAKARGELAERWYRQDMPAPVNNGA